MGLEIIQRHEAVERPFSNLVEITALVYRINSRHHEFDIVSPVKSVGRNVGAASQRLAEGFDAVI